MSGLFLLALATALAAGGPHGPAEALGSFVGAIASSDTTGALALLSDDAFHKVDSLLAVDPGLLCNLAQGFGVRMVPEDLEGMDSRKFLRAVLGSPALAGMLMFASYTAGEPYEMDGATFVPVVYRFMGVGDTLTVKMVESAGSWSIADYYGHAPVRSAHH